MCDSLFVFGLHDLSGERVPGRLGMKPESLSRAFARLRGLGVSVEQSTVEIADVARLREYAESERTANGAQQ